MSAMKRDLLALLCEAQDFVQDCSDTGYRRTAADRLLRKMYAAGVPKPPPWVPPPDLPRVPPPPAPAAPGGDFWFDVELSLAA